MKWYSAVNIVQTYLNMVFPQGCDYKNSLTFDPPILILLKCFKLCMLVIGLQKLEKIQDSLLHCHWVAINNSFYEVAVSIDLLLTLLETNSKRTICFNCFKTINLLAFLKKLRLMYSLCLQLKLFV